MGLPEMHHGAREPVVLHPFSFRLAANPFCSSVFCTVLYTLQLGKHRSRAARRVTQEWVADAMNLQLCICTGKTPPLPGCVAWVVIPSMKPPEGGLASLALVTPEL